VLFGLVDAGRTRIQGRTGLGQGIDELVEKFQFPLSIRGGPVAVSLLRKNDLLVGNDRDGRYDETEFVQILGAPFFGLYPVIVDHVVVGCLYFDRLENGPTLAGRQIGFLSQLRDLLAEAIRRKRPVARAG
jgi:hypothetical protein